MSGASIDVEALPEAGRVALIDLVQSPSHEARLAFPALLKSVVGHVGGRLVWAGSVDQQLVGSEITRLDDILISEYPDPRACARALAERQEWEPERIVSAQETYAATPWPGRMRLLIGALFGARRVLGGGPRQADPSDTEEELRAAFAHGDPALGPTREQLHSLVKSSSTDRVVMVNFLEYRKSARYPEGTEPDAEISGRAAYGRYGRVTASLIPRLGGRIRWAGTRLRAIAGSQAAVSGGAGDRPGHQMVVVEYPSRAAFLGMIRSPRYQAAIPHRDAGLERTDLLVCTSHAEFF